MLTPEETKAAVIAECDRIMSEVEVEEAHYFGNTPEQVWRIKFKDGTSISCYEEKPVESPQWIYLYRLLGLAERAVEARAQALVNALEKIYADLQSLDGKTIPQSVSTIFDIVYYSKSRAKDALNKWEGVKETA
jgi:hypothetical protein